ncbi:MAG: hypothetical protein WD708_05200 [Kiritimatiellia bacterium]
MTIRIDDSVIRGELDNRKAGVVTGSIWLQGQREPLELELEGNPLRDLAGHVIRFSSMHAPPGESPLLHSQQRGQLGALTASRKRLVPDCGDRELARHIRERTDFEWKRETLFQMEWFSREDGQVVLESTNFTLTLEGEAAWRMTPQQEEDQIRRNQEIRRECAEHNLHADLQLPELEEEDVDLTEVERAADIENARMELLNDRIQARMEEVEDIDEESYDRIYEEEREKLRIKWGEPEPEPLTPEEQEKRDQWIEELNQAADDALDELEEDGWEEMEDHPLVEQCTSLGFKVSQDLRDSGWEPEGFVPESPLNEISSGLQIASAKLAGALISVDEEWPPSLEAAGHVLVRLKKTRGYLRDALGGLDAADDENLGVPAWRNAVRQEIHNLLDQVMDLIDEVRNSLRG